MSFKEIQFPTGISYGAVGGPMFHTTVLPLGSGYEKRNIDWSRVRCLYDVSHNIKTQTDFDSIKAFFYNMQGKANGFRFKDWMDYSLPRAGIGSGGLGALTYQIYKTYTSGSSTFQRPIYKPVQSGYDVLSPKVWFNGTLLTSGVDYTLDFALGTITFPFDPGAHLIEVECEFDVPCRFDTDQLQGNIEFYNMYTWANIPIVEIRDIV